MFADKRFRANTTQVVGALVIGLLIAAGWYVTGHLGFGENTETLEFSYFGTNSRTLESMSFVVGIRALLLAVGVLYLAAALTRPGRGGRSVTAPVEGS